MCEKKISTWLIFGNKTTFFWPKVSHLEIQLHSVHRPSSTLFLFLLRGMGVEPPTKLSNGEGVLTGPELLEGVPGKEGVFFRRGGLIFTEKKKLKSDIFNDKKFIS